MKILIILSIPLIMSSSFVYTQDTLLIDEKAQEEIVLKVASIIQEKYVFANIGEKMAKHIIKQFEKGEYKSFIEVGTILQKSYF